MVGPARGPHLQWIGRSCARQSKFVYLIHERGRGTRPLPIVLTHGYPDSFLRFSKIIPMLTAPKAHGADPADSFDVVVPSLPAYGFSSCRPGPARRSTSPTCGTLS